MLKNYQNLMLRLVAWLMLGAVLMIALEVAFGDGGQWVAYRIPELLLGWAGILWLVHKYPRSNYASWFLVFYLVVGNAAWMGPTITQNGRMVTSPLYLMPLLFFFFLGLSRGALINLIFLAWLVAQLPMHGWDASIYGQSRLLFLGSYVATVAVCYLLEWIRQSIGKQSAAIAETDALTDLPNRSGFLLRMEAAIGRGIPFYLVHMDLDHFRRINLTTGSQYADELLRNVSSLLKSMPNVHEVARHYGDEFVFMVEGNEIDVARTVENIQGGLDLISKDSRFGIHLGASFGASHFPLNSRQGRELWGQAELALQKAKSEGRMRLRLYREEDADEERRLAYMVESLRTDVENDGIEVFFQPKISVTEKRVCGMEALARWNNPLWGMVPPPLFISLAEQHGFIVALGDQVARKSVAFLAWLQQSGYEGLSISINVSAAQLSQLHFVAHLKELCDEQGVSTGSIYLEITESLLLHGEMGTVLSDLRAKGFRLSLDDFGTGYSSMSYLHRYQFDELKVDKSFTDGLLRSGKERHVFRSILELSRGLGMRTVVEGVETLPQIETIRDLGAPQIQGWIFARAMPSEQLVAFLDDFDYDAALLAHEAAARPLMAGS